ncbi:DNA double-strand break repair nuclease NurA [Desulfolucanica intricata]|uniref:DNA double-strand break repair nuclease NurA n=1 Tax=Desulfolucanica intricata TaxID=1285191 RepID=UPI000835F2B3|nr:DNA double-strand break repair nuclease NurA [Desulfolucanica intricata]
MINQLLKENLKEINLELKNRLAFSASRAGLRKKLADNLGCFNMLSEMSADQILSWSGGSPVAAVDGSVNSIGSIFPYMIYLFQAQAKVSNNNNVVLTKVFSPLVSEHYRELEGHNELKISPEQALLHKKDCTLAVMELNAAMQSVREYQPFLIMFDGGFARFERYAFQEWQNYQKLALSKGILTVGVIEEAKSFGLVEKLELNNSKSPVYDREILFGLMNPGECFMPEFGSVVKKRSYYTAFARFSQAPQAIACDFLEQQSGQAFEIMNYLYSITPSGSRGIPILLDIVDTEIRLSNKELELLINVSLDAEIREKFFIPNRKRRDY